MLVELVVGRLWMFCDCFLANELGDHQKFMACLSERASNIPLFEPHYNGDCECEPFLTIPR
jgi:hypothetical protein